MDKVLMIIFIISAYAIVHSYVVYPLWIIVFTSKNKKPTEQFTRLDNLPQLGILMAAYNEEKVIGK